MAGKRGRSGRPKGKANAREIEQRRAAAKKPRNRKGERAKTAIKQAMQMGVIDLLKGPILDRQIDIALNSMPADSTRAASWIADRFGLPVQSEQSVRMEAQVAPLIEFRQTAFERPGSLDRRIGEFEDEAGKARIAEGVAAKNGKHTNGNGKAHRVAAGSPGDHPGS